jgi:hypothetical protein
METTAPTATSEPSFHEVQRFGQAWIIGLVAAVGLGTVILFGYALFTQLVLGRPFGNAPMSDGGLVAMAVCVTGFDVCLAALLLLARLETSVCDDGLHVHYHFLLVNRVIPYEDILDCRARTYRPIMEYGGWGVRWSLSHGKAYNVSGKRGVQLQLADGKKLLVGSQRADELADAINARRQALP